MKIIALIDHAQLIIKFPLGIKMFTGSVNEILGWRYL